MRTKQKRVFAAAGLGAVLAAGAVAVTANGADPAPDPGPKAALSVNAVLAEGTALTAAQRSDLASSAVQEYEGDLSRARSLAPPPGAKDSSSWVVVPAEDGGACLSVDGAVYCGPKQAVATTGVAGMRISSPDDTAPKDGQVIAGTAHIVGITPEGATKVVATSSAGKTVTVDAPQRLYQLDVPSQDLKTIEFVAPSGKTVLRRDVR